MDSSAALIASTPIIGKSVLMAVIRLIETITNIIAFILCIFIILSVIIVERRGKNYFFRFFLALALIVLYPTIALARLIIVVVNSIKAFTMSKHFSFISYLLYKYIIPYMYTYVKGFDDFVYNFNICLFFWSNSSCVSIPISRSFFNSIKSLYLD